MSIISAGSKARSRALLDNGFAMTISATSRKRDKLAAQLTWLANRHILNLPEDRRHGRFIAAQSDGAADPAERHQCRLPHHRPVGVGRRDRDRARTAAGGRRLVTIGKTPGRVVRHIEDGFAIEFTRLQHPDFIEENVTGE